MLDATFFRRIAWRAILLTAPLVLGSAGCGQQKYQKVTVEGAVTYNGKNVTNGDIRFIPTEASQGPTAGGDIIDGRYKIVNKGGVALGTHRVVLRAFIIEGVGSASPEMSGEGDLLAAGPEKRQAPKKLSLPVYEVEGRPQFLPPVYNRKSPLTVTVTGDENPQIEDFNMKSDDE